MSGSSVYILLPSQTHQNDQNMENRITSTNELENSITTILESYRKKVYAIIEEEMWNAFEDIGRCLEKCSRPTFEDSEKEANTIKAKEYMYVMSKKSISGISYATLQDICRMGINGNNLKSESNSRKNTYLMEFLKARTLSFEATRDKYPNYLKTWSPEDDEKLEQMWCEGAPTKRIAMAFGRNPGAIKARIKKLEFEEKYG